MHCPTRKQELHEIYRRGLADRPVGQTPPLREVDAPTDDGTKPRAAVGLLVSWSPSRDGMKFLLTLRSATLKQHANQVSLPGGMVDEADGDSYLTTLDREFEEEVGIPRGQIEWVDAPWENLRSRFGTLVTPFLGFVSEERLGALSPQASEVAVAEWLPLESLFDPQCWSERTIISVELDPNGRYRSLTLPIWTGWNHIVWGLTAAMLAFFVRRISGESSIGLGAARPL